MNHKHSKVMISLIFLDSQGYVKPYFPLKKKIKLSFAVIVINALTITTLWANSAGDKLMIKIHGLKYQTATLTNYKFIITSVLLAPNLSTRGDRHQKLLKNIVFIL